MKCPLCDDYESEEWRSMANHLRSHKTEPKGPEEKWRDIRSFIAKGGVTQELIDHLESVKKAVKERAKSQEEE